MKDNKSTKPAHKQGTSWKTAFRAPSYEEADHRRNKLLQGWNAEGVKNMQIKVKWLASTGSFIVKTRQDPTATPEPKKKSEKKGEKKGRRDSRDRKGRRSSTRQEQKG
jgi:hypothetical protein